MTDLRRAPEAPPPRKRVRMRPQEREQQIVEGAIRYFSEHGFDVDTRGLAAQLGGAQPWWTLGLWTAVSLGLLVGASLWLRRFRYGPLEWVQKSVVSRFTGSPRR